MKELEQKHLEAIEKETLDSWTATLGVQVSVCYTNDLATACALITHDYGEIQRLEGMIEVYKSCQNNTWSYYDFKMKMVELENQLQKLKHERPGN